MYMHYAGGGVGHYQVELSDPHNSESESTDDIAADNEDPVPTNDERVSPLDREEPVPTNDEGVVPTDSEEQVPTNEEGVVPTDGEEPVLPQAASEIDKDNPASDRGSDSGSTSDESEDGEGVPEADLPEDGEGGFVDAEDEEGYAEL